MAAGKGEETALGTARGRFIESLPRKAIELRGAIALLTATPAAEGPREDMRRRLHTLYASALVFRNDALAGAVKEGIERLDAARDTGRSLGPNDLEVLTRLVKRIPELRGDGNAERSTPSTAPTVAQMAAAFSQRPASISMAPETRSDGTGTPPARTARTLTGLAPIDLPVEGEATHLAPGPTSVPAPSAPEVAPAAPVSAAAESAPQKPAVSNAPAAQPQSRPIRLPLLQRVLHVLVLPGRDDAAELAGLLATDSLELTFADNVEDAIARARSGAPDVILADAPLAEAGSLIGGLRGDPLTDFVPVVLLEGRSEPLDTHAVRERGADDVVSRPLSPELLVRTIGRATGTLVEAGAALLALGDATLDEVAERVADEIRRGIVDAAETGRELRIPLGEGAEVLAAAWAAVARVRAFVSEQSAGRVRFGDRPNRSGPALLALGNKNNANLSLDFLGESALKGRRILVVDDDTAVVWFFAGLLREEGATVNEVTDGREALRAARRERPDVVISDILMPGLDGFALCRELKRDPALADVPVILISWKEDLLVRMRELSAGAAGYLRKEAGAAQILKSVRDVLEARTELETQLKAGGEVRGNLEGTGVVALLRSVRRTRPDARITIRDAWNLFECELRDGRLAQVTRTASDGSFVRGEKALPQLLGASAGRFAVADAEGTQKVAFEGTLDEVLTRGARELGALLDALSGPYLSRAARVVFDEDAYASVVAQTPHTVRDVVERLHAGEPPAKLLKKAGLHVVTLESILLDLARRGSIRGVVGTAGEDLVSDAKASRARETPTELGSPRSIIPPAPNPVISVMRADDLPSVLDPASAGDGLDPRSEPAPPLSSRPSPISLARSGEEEEPTADFDPLSRDEADRVLARARSESAPDMQGSLSAPVAESEPLPPDTESQAPEVPAAHSEDDEQLAPTVSRTGASSSAEERAQQAARLELAEPDPGAAEERRSRSTLAGWAVALLGFFAAAFFAERVFEPPSQPQGVEAIGGRAAENRGGEPPESRTEPSAAPAPAAPNAKPSSNVPSADKALAPPTALVVPQDSGFQIFDGIADKSLSVAPDQGLVIVEASRSRMGAELSVDERRIGALPAKLALSEGIHELAIAHGDAVTYRFVSVRRGKTWVLREP